MLEEMASALGDDFDADTGIDNEEGDDEEDEDKGENKGVAGPGLVVKGKSGKDEKDEGEELLRKLSPDQVDDIVKEIFNDLRGTVS